MMGSLMLLLVVVLLFVVSLIEMYILNIHVIYTRANDRGSYTSVVVVVDWPRACSERRSAQRVFARLVCRKFDVVVAVVVVVGGGQWWEPTKTSHHHFARPAKR